MKTYKFEKQLIDSKWYFVCVTHEHIPMIKCNSDGTYSVRNCNGKTIVHKEFSDAKKLALETAKKFEKLNKGWKDE